jgi:hypothetical protein
MCGLISVRAVAIRAAAVRASALGSVWFQRAGASDPCAAKERQREHGGTAPGKKKTLIQKSGEVNPAGEASGRIDMDQSYGPTGRVESLVLSFLAATGARPRLVGSTHRSGPHVFWRALCGARNAAIHLPLPKNGLPRARLCSGPRRVRRSRRCFCGRDLSCVRIAASRKSENGKDGGRKWRIAAP